MKKARPKPKKGLKTVLSIAGSDCSGGAGIQADLKTIDAYGLYGMSVLTAVTAQNTCGIRSVEALPAPLVRSQLEAVFEDIAPDAIKIGMLFNPEIVNTVAQVLSERRVPVPIVLDPVMAATQGGCLLQEKAISALTTSLLPYVCLITPNVPEAAVLSGIQIKDKTDMKRAAIRISKMLQTPVLLKGGHLNCGTDVLSVQGKITWFLTKWIRNQNTHGTGCTLSTAIACGLARGMGLNDAIYSAKAYVSGALAAGLCLGKGNGPLWHAFAQFDIRGLE